jgi:hypothetical protein
VALNAINLISKYLKDHIYYLKMYVSPVCKSAGYVLTLLNWQLIPPSQPSGITLSTFIVYRESHSTLSVSFCDMSIFFTILLICRSSLVSGSLWSWWPEGLRTCNKLQKNLITQPHHVSQCPDKTHCESAAFPIRDLSASMVLLRTH